MIINNALRIIRRHSKKLRPIQGYLIVVKCPTFRLGRDNIRDLILVEKVRKKYSSELLGSRSTLNVDNRGRGNRRDNKGLNKSRSKSKNKGKSKLYLKQAVCWNC